MSAFASLAGEARWVAWRAEQRSSNGKPTKIPYSQPSLKARADDPSTWQARDAAEQLATKIVNGLGGGIGIELGDIGADLYLGGVDLDSCIDEHGCLASWAEQILVELPTYAETLCRIAFCLPGRLWPTGNYLGRSGIYCFVSPALG